jgi:DegV family protein with EDD domain
MYGGIGRISFVPVSRKLPRAQRIPSKRLSSWFGRGWVKSCIRDGGDILEKLAIVTDSTSDLNQKAASEAGVTTVPLYVTHKDRVYRDAVDITPSTFYDLLEDKEELPKTSQPPPRDFEGVYRRLLGSFDKIISIHISRGLSSTADSAQKAADSVAPDRIHVVDSGFLTYGMTFQVLEAARLAKQALPSSEILPKLERLREKTEMLFTLDTMEFLYRGGRIGKVQSLMGSLLGIKPVVRVENGVYVPHGKGRNLRQALRGIVDFLADRFGRQKVIAAVGHGQGAQYASELTGLVTKALNVTGEPHLFEVGPVIGVHTGPGTVGLAVRPAEY